MLPNSPPLVLTAGLLFWGWFAGFLLPAVVMALLLESPRVLTLRWNLSKSDFERIADLCTLAFSAILLYHFVASRQFPTSLLSALTWLPILFFLLIGAQRFSTAGKVPLSALFWSLRARGSSGGPVFALDHAYLSLCALAASAANPRSPWFYAAVCLLALIAMWHSAPPGRARRRWGLTLAVAMVIGWWLQLGLVSLQGKMEEWALSYLTSHWSEPDPYQARTAIGDIGSLKTSDRIVMRVDAHGRTAPSRLRQAAYDVYAAGSWTASTHRFYPLASDRDQISIARGNGPALRISTWLNSGHTLLALPAGTYRLTGLNVGKAERNDLSTTLVMDGPDMLQYDAWADPSALVDAAPNRYDLAVPPHLAGPLERAADDAGLRGQAPQEIARRLKRFFDQRFEYSLTLTRAGGHARTLSDFLLTDRRGHCEYFATATVLLLRHAGVPARYAIGYSVHEFSSLERQHIVRARHAHAWALAWIDGRWQELDTTPARWALEESEGASPWQPLYDLASLLNYLFARWRVAPEDPSQRDPSVWLWLTLPLALVLGWRIYRRQRMRVGGTRREAGARSDARVTALLAALARHGYARPAAAPLMTWVAQLPLADRQLREALQRFVRDYYRLRFDPGPNDASMDQSLSQQARALERMLRS